GSQPQSGIVWAICPDGDANADQVHGLLRAFNATNVSVELWNSGQDPTHDEVGLFSKFCPPTIANGKVYVASGSGQLGVYGLRPGCPVTLSSAALSFPSGGGDGAVDVTANNDCGWSVTAEADFARIDSQSLNTGSGTVTFSVSTNAGSGRTGTIAIGNQVLTITQDGACSISLDSEGAQFKKRGGTGSIAVTDPGGCAWSARGNASWITLLSGSSSDHSGTVNYSVDANTDKASRTGT